MLGVVLTRQFRRHGQHLQTNNLQAFRFKSAQDLTGQAAGNSIGLEHDKRTFEGHSVTVPSGNAAIFFRHDCWSALNNNGVRRACLRSADPIIRLATEVGSALGRVEFLTSARNLANSEIQSWNGILEIPTPLRPRFAAWRLSGTR
jgi:hypothetical protein